MFKPVENVYYIKQQSFNTMDECYKGYLNQKESLKRVQKKHPTVSIPRLMPFLLYHIL